MAWRAGRDCCAFSYRSEISAETGSESRVDVMVSTVTSLPADLLCPERIIDDYNKDTCLCDPGFFKDFTLRSVTKHDRFPFCLLVPYSVRVHLNNPVRNSGNVSGSCNISPVKPVTYYDDMIFRPWFYSLLRMVPVRDYSVERC